MLTVISLEINSLLALISSGMNCLQQNLCVTAAYRPVRELIQEERKKDMVKTWNIPLLCSHCWSYPTSCYIQYLLWWNIWFSSLNNFKQEKKKREEAAKSSEDASETKEEAKEERVITLRPLNMEDMRQAKNQVLYLSLDARDINKAKIYAMDCVLQCHR